MKGRGAADTPLSVAPEVEAYLVATDETGRILSVVRAERNLAKVGAEYLDLPGGKLNGVRSYDTKGIRAGLVDLLKDQFPETRLRLAEGLPVVDPDSGLVHYFRGTVEHIDELVQGNGNRVRLASLEEDVSWSSHLVFAFDLVSDGKI